MMGSLVFGLVVLALGLLAFRVARCPCSADSARIRARPSELDIIGAGLSGSGDRGLLSASPPGGPA